jgi:carboxymethylenebutenolidase
MAGRTVKVDAADGAFDAYLAAPASGKGPGVVLVTHIFGVCEDTRGWADRLAGAGCVGIAPDFFWRDQDKGVLRHDETGYDRARARSGRTDRAKVMADLGAAIAALKANPACNGKVAAWGYCFGGPIVWRAACDGMLDIGASFHGTMVSRAFKPGDRLACPVTFQYGDTDELSPPEELELMKKTVAANPGSSIEIHPGGGHGFMMAHGRSYDRTVAEKSWDAAMALLAPFMTARAAE